MKAKLEPFLYKWKIKLIKKLAGKNMSVVVNADIYPGQVNLKKNLVVVRTSFNATKVYVEGKEFDMSPRTFIE